MLNVYEVEINGHTTTVQLSDEDARSRGLAVADKVAAGPPPTKARTRVRNKGA